MTTVVMDSSAILAFAFDEPGADVAESALCDGAMCSAANWAEVLQKLRTSSVGL